MQGLRHIDSDRRRVLRREVLDRDGWCCTWCGTSERLTLHHIIPVRRGGENTKANLITVCRPCHDELEVLERQYDEDIIASVQAIDPQVFVQDYISAQSSLGHDVSGRDAMMIRTLLVGRV